MRVRFTSREGAEDAVPDPRIAVISIRDPGSKPVDLQQGWFDVLSIEFHDIDLCKEINASLLADILKRYQPMAAFHALLVVAFVERCNGTGVDGFLIHCEAGISRSAAVAKWITDHYSLPSIWPAVTNHNRHVYKLLNKSATAKPLTKMELGNNDQRRSNCDEEIRLVERNERR
jgi:hypothetical protein